MTSAKSGPPFGDAQSQTLVESIKQEKNVRVARESLRNLMLFNNALEAEMKNISTGRAEAPPDQKLLDKMTLVREKYAYAMSGLAAFDDDTERHAFITLADAIQDLMAYMHLRRH